jgi:N-methylhydantoinase A
VSAARSRYRLGVDVGGTHTDLVLYDPDGQTVAVEKVASTPADPSLGVLEGLRRLCAVGVQASAIEFFAHGTTVTTNTLLQMAGARVGLLITAGYRGVQEVQTQFREGSPFDTRFRRLPPLVPQSRTYEIPERVDYEGRVLRPLDRDAVCAAARALRAEEVESIAVCYLFSFMHPAHEQETRAILQAEYPECHVSLSSEVLPQIREWPRLSATLLNAYLEPALLRYLTHLRDGLRAAGVATRQVYLMQSNGGVLPFDRGLPAGATVHTLLSGPAAGVQGAAYLAGEQGYGDALTLDVGGTSCDLAFIAAGRPLETTSGHVGGRELPVPSLEVTSIGIGGGSIVWLDAGGTLQVGPHSAGAEPGPACYGRPGAPPTVTDADLLLGYLAPAYFLSGRQPLDSAAAERALAAIASPLGLSPLELAAGVARIVEGRIADRIQIVAARRGVSVADCTLLPFGGAGAVHAAAVAAELGLRRVLVPPRPGAFSALGLLCTDVVHDYARSELRRLDALTPEHVEERFAELETRARADLEREDITPSAAAFHRALDLRYAGQGYELDVPLPPGPIDTATLAEARRGFDARHEALHGHRAEQEPVEAVNYRLRVVVAVPKFVSQPQPIHPGLATPFGTRSVLFAGDTQPRPATLYDRAHLAPGHALPGPAIVHQPDATTVVPPGWSAHVDPYGNVVISEE